MFMSYLNIRNAHVQLKKNQYINHWF